MLLRALRFAHRPSIPHCLQSGATFTSATPSFTPLPVISALRSPAHSSSRSFSNTSAPMVALQRSAFIEAIQKHDPEGVAVVHSLSGRSFKYGSLLQDIANAKEKILQVTGKDEKSISGERIAFLIENGYDYVVTLLACIASNAIAVPLSPSYPASELRYNLNHSGALVLLTSEKFARLAEETVQEGLDTPIKAEKIEKITEGADLKKSASVELSGDSSKAEGGMMLYTSGTTARPKGVVLPTSVLVAQSKSLVEAWKYSPKDRLLHVLPLHHIHGTVNAIFSPVLAGSSIEFLFPFNVDHVWNRLAAPFLPKPADKATITFLTAVPTVWARMLQTHSKLDQETQKAADEAIQRKNLRVNISGSAALPLPTKQAWTEMSSGNILLERYGMTEVGMALSCGLADEDRIDESVGWPLPSVEARLMDPDTNKVIEHGEELNSDGKPRSGEIHLRGPTIFKEYYRNPEATKKEFTEDGWFKTGDIAIRKPLDSLKNSKIGQGASGSWAVGAPYFIQGRESADIIKTGGEKVSALEIERELLSLPQIKECAVVGLPSVAWGQKSAAVVVLTDEGKTGGKKGGAWSVMDMRRALKGKLVAYKIPQDMEVVDELPRNAMGKINKKTLVGEIFGDGKQIRRRSIEVAEEREKLKKEGSQ